MSIRDAWRERELVALVGLVVALGIAWMPADVYPGDPVAAREETRALLLHGEFAVEPVAVATYRIGGPPGQYLVEHPGTGRSYSKYGPMAAWMYLVPLGLELAIEGRLPPIDSYCRVVYLNLFNIALSALLAASLYRTARRFDAAPGTAVAFVVVCFYPTFIWNTLRVQNSDIMQMLFFAWAVSCFLDVLDDRRRGASGRAELRLWAACTALVLTKVSYLPVGPMLALGLAAERRLRTGCSWPAAGLAEARRHALPCAALVAVWLELNTIKFGHPLRTGYHADSPDAHWFTGDLAAALAQLCWSPRRGLIWLFPVLPVALAWMPRWLRTRPVAYGTLLGLGVGYTLLLAKLPCWDGGCCYGPRYWSFMLPFVSLPALAAIDWLRARTPAALAAIPVVALALGYSTWLQVQVNRFPFLAAQYAEMSLDAVRTPAVAAFFATRHDGRIVHTLWRHRDRLAELPWWREAEAAADTDARRRSLARAGRIIRTLVTPSNLYWFPRAEDAGSADAEDVAHRVEARGPAHEEPGGGQGAPGVAVAVGGPHRDGERLAVHPEEDRVLAGIVAGPDGVIPDLVGGPGPRPALAAMDGAGLPHRLPHDGAELQRRAAR